MKNNPLRPVTKQDIADYLAAREIAETGMEKWRLTIIWQTCFWVMWPDRFTIDLVCGLKDL